MEYESEFGILIVGRFDGRFRRDIWVSRLTGERFAERCFATGPNDKSNAHNSMTCYGGSYDPRCSCCWLNFGHTEEYHKRYTEGGSNSKTG